MKKKFVSINLRYWWRWRWKRIEKFVVERKWSERNKWMKFLFILSRAKNLDNHSRWNHSMRRQTNLTRNFDKNHRIRIRLLEEYQRRLICSIFVLLCDFFSDGSLSDTFDNILEKIVRRITHRLAILFRFVRLWSNIYTHTPIQIETLTAVLPNQTEGIRIGSKDFYSPKFCFLFDSLPVWIEKKN